MGNMVVLEAPRFYPTLEEFVDFSGYVEKIEEEVDDYGLCVVVPPKGWAPRKREKYDDLDEVTVQKPIRQEFTGSKGVYYCLLLESRSLPVKEFKTSAEQFAKRFGPENNIRGLNGKGMYEQKRRYGTEDPYSLFCSVPHEQPQCWDLTRRAISL